MNKTIAKIGYAPITSTVENPYSYGAVTYLETKTAGGRKVTASPKGDSKDIYADGIVAVSLNKNSGYEIDIETLAIIDKVEKAWLGCGIMEDGSVIEIDDGKELPRMALVIAQERYNAAAKYEVDVYYNAIVTTRPNRNGKTAEGSVADPDFPTYKFTATPRDDNKLIRQTFYVDTLPTTIETPTDAEIEKALSTKTVSESAD